MNKLQWGILGILGLLAIGGYMVYKSSSGEPSLLVGNFQECVEAGNPVMESYPRQCRSAEGDLFVEDIEAASLTGGEYIRALDWPPAVEFTDEPFECLEAGSSGERAGETEERMINGRAYCITKILEGATGSVYTQYAYATEYNGGTAVFSFSTRESRCANYPAEESVECEAEQASFNPDMAVHSIVEEQLSIGAGSLEE